MYEAANTAKASGSGIARAQPSAPSERTATDRLSEELGGAIDRIHVAIDRVRGFADHMLGGAAGSAPLKDAPGRSGRTGQLQDLVDQIHASLSSLESEIERLGSI